MGVPGLWPFLYGAAEVTTILELAEGAFRNSPCRGFRIGIDASIWDFHSRTIGKDAEPDQDIGKNPEVRMVMFRLEKFIGLGCLPVVVFDGSERPSWKRGHFISGHGRSALEAQVQQLCEVLRIPWVRARGEAEAELARMNARGEIDGVVTDDVDTLLFGATLVVRNNSEKLSGNNTKIAPEGRPAAPTVDTVIYKSTTIFEKLNLTRQDLIMIALLSGGDYIPEGVTGCGPKIAHALAQIGYAESLLRAENKAELDDWREEVCVELETDRAKRLGRRQKKLAADLRSHVNFPRVDVLRCYTDPAVKSAVPLSWDKEIDMATLVPYLETTFEWSHVETRNKLRNIFWKGFFMQDLRRAALASDATLPRSLALPSFYSSSKASLASSSKSKPSSASSLTPATPRGNTSTLIAGLHEFKNGHTTSFLPSYRVELDPSPFLSTTTPHLSTPELFPYDFSALQLLSQDGETLRQKNGTRETTGTGDLRHWIPVEMLKAGEGCKELIEGFEQKKEEKERKKKSPVKGRGKAKEKAKVVDDDSESEAASSTQKSNKSKGKAKASLVDDKAPSVKSKSKPTTSASFKARIRAPLLTSDLSSDDDEFPQLREPTYYKSLTPKITPSPTIIDLCSSPERSPPKPSKPPKAAPVSPTKRRRLPSEERSVSAPAPKQPEFGRKEVSRGGKKKVEPTEEEIERWADVPVVSLSDSD
ncbi:putative DNA repair endonuclease rad2 [Pseudohyphozyma bogoriensis]|nr:putative DNA repair endonuclease rad2 [Pseudohyphozyma bogoriensis]